MHMARTVYFRIFSSFIGGNDMLEAVATTPKLDIGGANVKSALQTSQTSAMLLQVYTQTVLQTPDIKLNANIDELSNSTVVSDLPKHQALARANATTYLNNINPLMVSKSADVIGFCNLWNAEYATLVELAKAIDAPGNSDKFKAGIANLIKQTQAKKADGDPVISALNAILPAVQTDRRNIGADAQYVAIALGGVNGEIKQLQDRIDADHQAIQKDIGIIAGGAVGVIVGAIMIVVGVVAEAVTGGAATLLVVGGIAFVAGGTTAMGLAGKNLHDTQADLATSTKTLAIDQLCFASTKQAGNTIAALDDALSDGITAIINLQKGWAALEADLQQVVDQLGSATPDLGDWLVNVLDAADKDWKDAYDLAKGLQSYGTLPVKSVNFAKAA